MTESIGDRENLSGVVQKIRALQQYDYKFGTDLHGISPCAYYSIIVSHALVAYPEFEKSSKTLRKLQFESRKMEEALSDAELSIVSPLLDRVLRSLRETDIMIAHMKEADELIERVRKLSEVWVVKIAGIEQDLNEIRQCFSYAIRTKHIAESENRKSTHRGRSTIPQPN